MQSVEFFLIFEQWEGSDTLERWKRVQSVVVLTHLNCRVAVCQGQVSSISVVFHTSCLIVMPRISKYSYQQSQSFCFKNTRFSCERNNPVSLFFNAYKDEITSSDRHICSDWFVSDCNVRTRTKCVSATSSNHSLSIKARNSLGSLSGTLFQHCCFFLLIKSIWFFYGRPLFIFAAVFTDVCKVLILDYFTISVLNGSRPGDVAIVITCIWQIYVSAVYDKPTGVWLKTNSKLL